MTELTTYVAFISVGVLAWGATNWFGRFQSERTDHWEREGVIRYGGGFGLKVWKENEPQKFERRIKIARFSAAYMRILGAGFGASSGISAWTSR